MTHYKSHVTKTTHGWYLQSPHSGLEEDSSKLIGTKKFPFFFFLCVCVHMHESLGVGINIIEFCDMGWV